jgi:acetylornithine deacetylase
MNYSEEENKFVEAAAAKEKEWAGKLAEMIRIDSQSGKEAELARYVHKELARLGVESEMFDIPSDIEPGNVRPEWMFRNRPNVVGRIPGGGGGKSLILSCHLDTQPVYPRECWRHDPLGGEIEGDNIFGRGSVDDKAGIAEVLYLLDCLHETKLKLAGDLILEFIVEDETTGLGTLACLRKGYKADGALIIDGTNLDNAFYAHPGHINFEISVLGIPTTSASAFRSRNPFFGVSKIVEALKAFEETLRREDHGLFNSSGQPVNFNFVFGECGHSSGATPSRALLYGLLSFCPPWTVECLREKIREVVENACAESDTGQSIKPEIRFMGYMNDSTIADAGSELAGIVARKAMEREGIAVRALPMRGVSDLRHFIKMTNGNCLLYGPGAGAGVHINEERFVLSDMKKCINILFGVVSDWCGLEKS